MISKKIIGRLSGLLMSGLLLASCQKDTSLSNGQNNSGSSSAIAVALSGAAGAGSPSDSIYVIHECGEGHHRDSIAAANLPSSVTGYLSANYPAYNFWRAFSVKDHAGNTSGYVVIIFFNGKPVGLALDASGNFLKVLEQREGRDLHGKGWHDNGRFGCRDGKQGDTLAIKNLPAAILNYFAANYPQDTLIRSYWNRDSAILVLSANNGLYVTIFNASGGFVKREAVPAAPGRAEAVEQAVLPASVINYLSTTYPAYVFNKAFKLVKEGSLQGYIVFIEANTTRYAVKFDAAGHFVAAKTIW